MKSFNLRLLSPYYTLNSYCITRETFCSTLCKMSVTYVQLTILQLQENQSQAEHQPELHSCGSAGLEGHREGGRGRQVRFFTGTCRLQRHSLDFQLHPQQRQGATKKGKESLQSPSVNSPLLREWKYRHQSPLLAKSVNHNVYVNRLPEQQQEGL